MEVTREQIELLQKHEVDEHTILEIIKDLADKQADRNVGFASIPDHRIKAKPRKKRATKAEMEARRKLAKLDKQKQDAENENKWRFNPGDNKQPDDFDQAKVDAALAEAKRHLGKQKQTDFNPEAM